MKSYIQKHPISLALGAIGLVLPLLGIISESLFSQLLLMNPIGFLLASLFLNSVNAHNVPAIAILTAILTALLYFLLGLLIEKSVKNGKSLVKIPLIVIGFIALNGLGYLILMVLSQLLID